MRTGLLLRQLHRGENALGHQLLHVAQRHRRDHEIHHVGCDLVEWSWHHVRELADLSLRHGIELGLEPEPEPEEDRAPAERLREAGSEFVSHLSDAGLLLLRDIRTVYVQASGVAVDWAMLGQAAQVTRDDELLALAEQCRPETLRQARWAQTKLMEISPQVLLA